MATADRSGAGALLERDGELARLAQAIAAAGGGEGAIVAVEGPAGIGKTRLLAAARGIAAEAGAAVLAARGSDLEREFRWGVVRQMLEPALVDRSAPECEELLAGAAGLAAPLLSPAAPAAPTPPAADEGALLHGLYWLCANLAERRPLLLAIDDAHWGDLASLRFLAYLARRVEGLPLTLVVASRPGESSEDGRDLLARLAAEPAASVLRPKPLGERAVAHLLDERLGAAPDPSFAASCREATRGNPFLLEELARAVREEGLAPDGAAAERVADLGPRSVARTIMRRVRRLAPGAVELAGAVSVLGSDADLRRTASLAGLEAERAAAALDALLDAEVLAPGRPLDFIHPLARAAIYGDLGSGERARLHARAAQMLAAEAAPSDRVAAHLLATEPSGDPARVELLRAAAAEAIASGAPATAVSQLERALAEPPPADELAGVLYELGRAEALDGRPRFEHHLQRAWDLAAEPRLRARAVLDLGRAKSYAGDFGAGGRIWLQALAELGDRDAALTRALESELFAVAFNEHALGEDVRPLLRRRLEELAAGEVSDRALLASLGLALAAGAPPACRGGAVAERARTAGLPEDLSLLPGCIGNALLFAGELEGSARYYDDIAAEARRRGSKAWTAYATSFRARPALELGDVRRAEEDARLGLQLLDDAVGDPGPHAHAYLTAHLAYALLERGELEEAAALLEPDRPADDAGAEAGFYAGRLLLGARGRLRLAQGRAEEALADARASAPGPLLDGNPAVRPWRSDAAHALAALGRHEEGRELAAEELALARSFEVPGTIACALRAQARCAETHEAAIEVLEEAVATAAASPARLEQIHATIDLGAALRRAGSRRTAVEHLRRGLDLAHRGGATALRERARAELLSAGARPRRPLLSGVDSLTAAERRVAELAARGKTNREIAQELFVTARTVEGHLTNAYRKLEISSRGELAEALTGPQLNGP